MGDIGILDKYSLVWYKGDPYQILSSIYFRVGVIVICNHDYLKSITFFSSQKVICNRGFL